jgi:hypothetical protein
MENWAYYMPLEKVLQFAEGTLSEAELTFVQAQIALRYERSLA